MFYLMPAKRGLGVEIWGSHDDLKNLYDVIAKFWNQNDFENKIEFDNRDSVISGFIHEIRKTYQGRRLKREHNHFSMDRSTYYGCEISWPHLLFAICAVRYNMRYLESDKYDLAMILQLEYWTQRAMRDYDEVGARDLENFIADGIYQGNPYTYQFMRSIDVEHFRTGGGKAAFRKLSQLLRRAVYGTEEYNSYYAYLALEAQKQGCDIHDLEISDDN